MTKILLNSKKEMADFAKKMAKNAKKGDIFALFGTLGAGKSFFAKNFINSLQKNPSEVLSPTFNLVYDYETTKGKIFHFDLYRLKDSDELENIGFFDAIQNSICLIEWPQIAQKFLAKNTTKIIINNVLGNKEESREIIIENF